MEILTYMLRDGKFSQGGKKSNDSGRERFLGVVPMHGVDYSVVLRRRHSSHDDAIHYVFCVIEARTKNPLSIRLNQVKLHERYDTNHKVFPLDYTNDELELTHTNLTARRYESLPFMSDNLPRKRPDYDDHTMYLMRNFERGLEIGLDEERKKPGMIHKFKGTGLESKLIVKSWVKGNSPTAKYPEGMGAYTADNFGTMFEDKEFRAQLLPKLTGDTMTHGLINLPETEELGRYLVLW